MDPLSELYGRNIIYRASYFVFFAFSFAVAFAPDIGVSHFAEGYASSKQYDSHIPGLPLPLWHLRCRVPERRCRKCERHVYQRTLANVRSPQPHVVR